MLSVFAGFNERSAAVRQANPDFDAVLQSAAIGVSDAVMETILESDDGPAVAYHLAKNPTELYRLNAMTERQQVFELGRISARLSAKSSGTEGDASAATRAGCKSDWHRLQVCFDMTDKEYANSAGVRTHSVNVDNYRRETANEVTSWLMPSIFPTCLPARPCGLHTKSPFSSAPLTVSMMSRSSPRADGNRATNCALPTRTCVHPHHGSRVMDVQDQAESSQTITVATQDHVDMRFNSAELALITPDSIGDFSDRYLVPAMSALISGIEGDFVSYATKRVYNSVGTPGTRRAILPRLVQPVPS